MDAWTDHVAQCRELQFTDQMRFVRTTDEGELYECEPCGATVYKHTYPEVF